ncbi:alkaline phosphatase family protein [Anaerocolumna sp. MB42-C2]|uniref:alkaline phosphatase family protein n=1 Tax=Anaerocolumna sp. MB42-C2 TaxID=3070997 RepID=UPI0027E1398D|nr:ectonucleotide pyrophosphatase/phosphodiesterase [Anaerocolumna sp. MB42-C2]WMJ87285.1 ectonucleotide pyrophosphatase/phosphodiesterase [Anaerocolumna sp. MB42-C2]
MGHNLIVLSIDSLQTTDLIYLKNKPNFAVILKKCALVKNIREIYPTLTYPIHTTIITGVHPNTHGITHNQLPSIEKDDSDWSIMGSDWNWYSKAVKIPSLVDAANEKNLVTASVMWPVMGGHKPDHNLAEIWPNRYEDMRVTFERACTKDIMELYYDRYLVPFDWEHRTDMDSYSIDIAVDMIKRFKPDLTLIHSICLDHCRHEFGDEGSEIDECLDRVDRIVGSIVKAAEDAGIYEDTNFVILGDHGQINIRHVFQLNILLKQLGFIRTDLSGKVIDYDAYSFSAGFSTHIMLKEPQDEALEQRVYSALLKIQREYGEYMGRIFNKEEVAREEGLSGSFSFVVESADGVIFDNALNGEVISEMKHSRDSVYHAMHGHHPSKGPKPPFLAFGPDIKEGEVIESGDMLDECPTLAKLLQVDMKGMEGKPFHIFYKEN